MHATIREFSKHKEIELRLRESEEKFRSITEHSLMGIAILQDDRFRYVNKTLAGIVGYTPEEMTHWDTLEYGKLIHPDDRVMALEQARKRQLGLPGAVVHYEFRGITKYGDIKWLEIYSNTINYQGSYADLITIIDITEKKESEQKLNESEEKFRNIAEQSLMGILILQDGVFKYFNDRISEMNGYSAEEMKDWAPHEWVKAIYLEDREFVMEQARKKQTGDPDVIHQYRYRTLKKNGEIRWMEIFSKTITYKGRPADLAMTIDITDKIKAELQLKESEEKYRELVETSSMGLLEIDLLKKKVSYVNPKLLEIISYSREELMDDTIFYKVFHPEDLQEITKTKKDQDLEFRIITKEGRIKWLSGRRLFQFNESGEIKGLRLWLQDITDKKILGQLKKQFVDRTSHELKTPLISIKGFTQLLLELYENRLDNQVVSILNNVLKGCDRLEILIRKIIESSRLASGKLDLNKAKEDLSFLIKYCVQELLGFAETRKISISLELHDTLITEFEKEKIYTAFSNLLINAIQYTPPNGEITIKSEIKEDYFIISIQDTGIGFTEDEKERIFTKFGKIERYGKGLDVGIEGSGLGLYISKKIVELHGGHMWMESEGKGKGSTFFFSLPIVNN